MIDGNAGVPSTPFGWWEIAYVYAPGEDVNVGGKPERIHLLRLGRAVTLYPMHTSESARLTLGTGRLLCGDAMAYGSRLPNADEYASCACSKCVLLAVEFQVTWPESAPSGTG